MQSKKVHLTKEYVKVVEFIYPITKVDFESALKHVEFLHHGVMILRDNIHPERDIMDGRVVILGEKSTS